jgi:hypothetical protein
LKFIGQHGVNFFININEIDLFIKLANKDHDITTAKGVPICQVISLDFE